MTRNIFSLGAVLLLAAAAGGSLAAAAPPGPWSAVSADMAPLLRLQGDPVRGKAAYRGCQGCHRADGAGRPDGTYPRLAGQHASVVLKQVTDTRAGRRINPKMDPFASDHAVTAQELVDITAFLLVARPSVENGKGDAATAARGAALYGSLGCDTCHGRSGEGDAAQSYPAVAAQHHGYLTRELGLIQSGERGNSHPEMVKGLRGVSQADLEAMAAFMSRLPDARDARR